MPLDQRRIGVQRGGQAGDDRAARQLAGLAETRNVMAIYENELDCRIAAEAVLFGGKRAIVRAGEVPQLKGRSYDRFDVGEPPQLFFSGREADQIKAGARPTP